MCIIYIGYRSINRKNRMLPLNLTFLYPTLIYLIVIKQILFFTRMNVTELMKNNNINK